jgi:hypothetical protein
MGATVDRAGRVAALGLAFLLLLPALAPRIAVAQALPAEMRAAMCGARESCAVVSAHPAGATQRGDRLTVVQLRFGVADRPKHAPEAGCRDGDRQDGGTEYWLLRPGDPPRLVLALCNDGYGASGVGDDEVEIGDNRLVHVQAGGSAWRWEVTRTVRLAPLSVLAERRCSYHTVSPATGTITDIDYTTMVTRTVAKDSGATWREDEGAECPDWPAQGFSPEPGPRLVAGYDLMRLPQGADGAPLARGTLLGSCALALSTDGERGFLVFGKPATGGATAEIKAIADTARSLIVQVYDPTRSAAPPAPPASWIHLPHVELWLAPGGEIGASRPDPEKLQQIAVDLDGRAYAAGKGATALPAIERWTGRDAAGRAVVTLRLAWPSDEALLGGVGLAYSQPEAGKRARLVATTGMRRNRPLFLPPLVALAAADRRPAPPSCTVRDGRLEIVAGR